MKSVFSHSAQAIAEGILISLLVVGLMAGTAFAGKSGAHGKPGGGGTTGGAGSISLAPLVSDANGNGLPNYRDVVVFSVSTTATTTPYVNLVCSQNGTMVLSGWKGYWAGSIDTNWNFGLSSGAWQGGSAECVASLKMQTRQGWSSLASTSFHVDG
jgi:hypothetical protein